jgi:hypothetical protein
MIVRTENFVRVDDCATAAPDALMTKIATMGQIQRSPAATLMRRA